MATTKKSPSVLEQAHQNLAALTSSEESLVAELAKLETEHEHLEQAAESGDASADIARLDEVTETELPRVRRRLEAVREVQIPAARERVAVAELAELVDSLAGGLAGEAQRLADERAEGERLIGQGVQRLRDSASRWNGVIEPIISRAAGAGLIVGETDPMYAVQAIARPYRGVGSPRPVAVLVDGGGHAPVDADRAIEGAVRKADQRLGAMVAKVAEEERLESFRLVERATSR